MEIELCKQCNGRGLNQAWNNKEDLYENIECTKCRGTGRVFKLSFKREFPFTYDYKETAKIINFEDKIAKLIRDEKLN